MGIFNLDSPLMQVLNKIADMMLLNVLTLVCCIPVVTAGASLTAMHYMALKMARGEDYYLVRGFFKSFKENFKQATIIWLLLLLMIVFLVSDYLIMANSTMEFPFIVKIVITVVAFLPLLTSTFIFPALARFENTIFQTIKNAFMMSILQFPKTILMIILNVLPLVLFFIFPQLLPIILLFGLAVPAFGGAHLYNKFFKKLEDHIRSVHPQEAGSIPEEDEDEKIFHDQLVEDPEESVPKKSAPEEVGPNESDPGESDPKE